MTGPERVAAAVERMCDILERHGRDIRETKAKVEEALESLERLETAVGELSKDYQQVRRTLDDAARRGQLSSDFQNGTG